MIITTQTASQYSIEGQNLLAVPWQILDGDTVLFEGSQSFDLTATTDEIKAFLSQTLSTHIDDMARHADAALRQEASDTANQTIAEISNISISQ